MVLAQTGDAWARANDLQGIWLPYGIAIIIAMMSFFTELLIYTTQAAAVERQRGANSGLGLTIARSRPTSTRTSTCSSAIS